MNRIEGQIKGIKNMTIISKLIVILFCIKSQLLRLH
ncbi:hypothetical protein [Cytobacillus oceanisediminis]